MKQQKDFGRIDFWNVTYSDYLGTFAAFETAAAVD
jgi:hypothetical protein